MVHGDRGQRRNGQSSPATPFGLAFIGVGEQRPLPPAIQSREGLRASRSVRPGLRPLPKPSPCGQRSLGSSERRRTSRGALDKRPQRVVPASVGVYRRGLQGPLHVDFTRFAKPPVRVRYFRIGALRGNDKTAGFDPISRRGVPARTLRISPPALTSASRSRYKTRPCRSPSG
jgi:hypothetical protein